MSNSSIEDSAFKIGFILSIQLVQCRSVFNVTDSIINVLIVVKQNYGGQVSALPKPLLHYFSRFYYDTAVGGSAPAIRCAYEVFGADQLIFATDAPWGPGTGEFRLAEYPKVIESLGLSEAENKKIFADNARRIFNLN